LIDLRKPYRSAENAGFPYRLLSQCDVDHTSPPFNAQKVSLTSNKAKGNLESLRRTSQMSEKVGYVVERASHSPPSTTRIAPVTQLAAGEARNATAFAMSLGAPQRPSGICVAR
jgi:hypothetical protein